MGRTAATQRDPYAEAARELQGPAQIGPPEVEAIPGGSGYVATFAKAQVRLRVEQLRQGRDGLKAELTAELGPYQDGGWRGLTSGRLELNSISQREAWERRLGRRWQAPWGEILDRTCLSVTEAEKHLDRPWRRLREAPELDADADTVLDPIVHDLLPTLWYGDGGSMKSLVALAAGVSLHCGFSVVGGLQPRRRGGLLYADFEFDWRHHKDRMRRLLGLQRDDPEDAMPEVAYIDCNGSSLTSQVERIQRAVRECGAQFLIVDSISYAAEGPLNDDDTARSYYRALAQIGLPSISTCHVSKNGDQRRPFGSVHWLNLCRLAWQFQRMQLDGQREVVLKLTCQKASTDRTHDPVWLSVQFGEHRGPIRITPFGQGADGARAELTDLWRQAQALLQREDRFMTYDEMALALGVPKDNLSARIRQHREAFVFLGVPGSRTVRVGVPGTRATK